MQTAQLLKNNNLNEMLIDLISFFFSLTCEPYLAVNWAARVHAG
jgi:hypothetical protein